MLVAKHNLATLFGFARPSIFVLGAFSFHRFAFEQWLRFRGQKGQVVDPFDYACAYKTNTTKGVNSFKHDKGRGKQEGIKRKRKSLV